ncbi:MAG: FimV/HubP family polar landmark protein [Nitrosomonadaceae bacterium]|nr:FimV/HubP family polar landmark protein [Nitrosomonadaceae bacterium]
MSPWAVHAAGLGKLTVNSALGQPFKAEIDLVVVKKEEIPSLAARLASRDAFRKADVDYAPFLSTFTVSVEARSDGQPYIRIVSPQPVVEPFLSMLIELNWASGRLLREYTVLLDLPETDRPQPVAPTTQIAPAIQIAPTEPPVVEAEPIMVEKPDAPIKDFISDKKPAILEPVPVGRTGGATYGPIRSGDTLSRIARQVAPDGVNLNQMLVALHRANRDTFSGNNINRLKAGPILRVPDSSEIAQISPTEAAIEVKTQIADWNAYRQKLAAATGATPATGAPKQTASGKITTIVEDNSASAREPSKEVLKLSKGEELGGAGGKGVDSQGRIRAMEEDAIARNKALNEANERIALLEKNIQEMQRLLELKSTTMVEAQKRAESLKPDVVTSSSAPTASPQPAPAPAVSAESEDVNAASVAPDASSVEETTKPVEPAKPVVDSTVTPVAPPPVPVESSLMDDLMQNIEYVGGVLALLLTGMLGVSMMRRKKEIPTGDSDVMVTPHMIEPQLYDEALPVAAAPAPAAVPEAVISTGDVDPVAEAEIYLAYGRNTQAEKTLTEALAKDPNRLEILAKLLEVYVQRKDKAAFEVTARALQAVAPSSPLWERAAGLGAGIDPGNPLYGDAVATNTGAAKDDAPAPISDSPKNVTTSEMTSAVNFDMAGAASTPANQSVAATALAMPTGEDLEKAMVFDLNAPATNAAVETPLAEDTGLAFNIDFPATAEPEPEPEPEPAAVSELDFAPLPKSDLVDIDLNMVEPPPALSTDMKPTESAHWHEIASKIDLARAYQEMGDNDGAREILEEVVREGDAQQQESARTMLASL